MKLSELLVDFAVSTPQVKVTKKEAERFLTQRGIFDRTVVNKNSSPIKQVYDIFSDTE